MYCIECGKANPDGAKFCAYCGVKLFTGEPVPTVDPIPSEPEPAVDVQAAQEQAPVDIPAHESAPQQAEVPVRPDDEPARFDFSDKIQTGRETAPVVSSGMASPKNEPMQGMAVKSAVRVRRARTLQPTMENPAQPDREPRQDFVPQPFVQIRPEPEADEPFFPPKGEPAPQDDIPTEAPEPQIEDWWEEKQAAPQKPAPAAKILPPEDLWADAPDDEPEPDEPRKKFTFPWQRDRGENMVLTASGTEEMPARKPVIARKKRDTHVPERIVKREEPEADEASFDSDEEKQDIFFIRPKKPRRQDEDSIDDAYVNSRVRTILFAIGFVTCLFVAVWLFATASGQMFLAGFNLSTNAEAYRDLGDSALGNNQVKRAAEAYYRALSLDPDDYETALLVGKTQQQIGEYDTAADAYFLCTQLQPASAEPYQALIRLYEIQNEPEKADYFRSLGCTNAGID